MNSLHLILYSVITITSFQKCIFSLTETPSSCQLKEKEDSIHNDSSYGIDYSWPQHHYKVEMSEVFGNDRHRAYDEYMHGCYEKGGREACDEFEDMRITMNVRQPQSVKNYTSLGFKKIRAPAKVFALIKEFWEANKDKQSIEEFENGDASVNTWSNPSYIVSVENSTLHGGGTELRNEILDAAEDTVREWTGQPLQSSSCYGIRVYTKNAVLTSHVDRLPLISSAIINVAQDVDEPWPLEIIGHGGIAYNVTMEPGDMVLYESHSIIHGRPFPLKGRFYANIFIHFAPIFDGRDGSIPSYVIEGSPEDIYRRNVEGYEDLGGNTRWIKEKSTSAHDAAFQNDIPKLIQLSQHPKTLHTLTQKDRNGWTPFHEAARMGHLIVLKLLLLYGGEDGNIKTDSGERALDIAMRVLEEGHVVIVFLSDLLHGDYTTSDVDRDYFNSLIDDIGSSDDEDSSDDYYDSSDDENSSIEDSSDDENSSIEDSSDNEDSSD